MSTRRSLLAALIFAAAPAARAAPARPVVTLLGDSITAGLGLAAKDALPARLQADLAGQGVAAEVRAAGVSGDTTAGGLARVDFSVQPDTRLCVVELGANDYLQSVDPRDICANLTALVRRLKARGIGVVLVAGRAPAASSGSYGRAFNAVFPEVARATGAVLAPDFLVGVSDNPALKQADGLHPDAAGVRLIAQRLAPVVARALRTGR
jgi:acyl-CoA thioesterase-1